MSFSARSLAKILISVLLLVFFVAQIDIVALFHGSEYVSFNTFLCALTFILCQIFFLNLRWHVLMNGESGHVPFRVSSLINISGYLANIFFIASVGGIVAKSALSVGQGLSFTYSLFITFFDRLLTFKALILFSIIGLPFLTDVLDSAMLISVGFSLFFLCCLGLGAVLILKVHGFDKFLGAFDKLSHVQPMFCEFVSDVPRLLRCVVYSLCAQACFILAVFVLSWDMGVDYDPLYTVEFFALMPVIALISSLPISFGGWGVREGAFIYGLALIGFSLEDAFLLSVQVGLITLIAPLLIAIPYLLNTDCRDVLMLKRSKVVR